MPVEPVSVSNVSQLLFVNLSSADSINFLRDQMRALSVVLFLRTLVAPTVCMAVVMVLVIVRLGFPSLCYSVRGGSMREDDGCLRLESIMGGLF